jgi:hypothetical protein
MDAQPVVIQLALANGALLRVPIHETHHRGTNWLAIIDIDGTAPGGLARQWIPRGKGECYYLIEQVALFAAVEFAAGYTTGVGRKKPHRWYGVVTGKTDDYLQIEQCSSGANAVLRSKALRTSPEALAQALAQDRDALITRAAKLEQQIQELRTPPAADPPVVVEEPKPADS